LCSGAITQNVTPVDETDIKTLISNVYNTTSIEQSIFDQTSLQDMVQITNTPVEQLRQTALEAYKNNSNYPLV
jgi:hypothetical protein